MLELKTVMAKIDVIAYNLFVEVILTSQLY